MVLVPGDWMVGGPIEQNKMPIDKVHTVHVLICIYIVKMHTIESKTLYYSYTCMPLG